MGMTQTNARYHPSQSEPLCIVSTKTPDLEPKKEAETQACIRIVSDVQFLLLRQNVLLWREGMQRRVGSSSSAGSFLTMEMTELREGGCHNRNHTVHKIIAPIRQRTSVDGDVTCVEAMQCTVPSPYVLSVRSLSRLSLCSKESGGRRGQDVSVYRGTYESPIH